MWTRKTEAASTRNHPQQPPQKHPPPYQATKPHPEKTPARKSFWLQIYDYSSKPHQENPYLHPRKPDHHHLNRSHYNTKTPPTTKHHPHHHHLNWATTTTHHHHHHHRTTPPDHLTKKQTTTQNTNLEEDEIQQQNTGNNAGLKRTHNSYRIEAAAGDKEKVSIARVNNNTNLQLVDATHRYNTSPAQKASHRATTTSPP